MPVTSASGNAKESTKSKKKGTTADQKNVGETSSGRGVAKQKETTQPVLENLPSTSSTSTRIITTPSRYNHPFLRSSVKKPAKIQSPPPASTEEKVEENKEKPKAERKRWEAWSNQDKNLFFDAIAEHGKDFESVQKTIEHKHKKLGYPPNQIKNKDQVRHLYYRTCHTVFKYVTPFPDQPKVNNELFALINYGELRKKLKGALTPKYGRKLDELVTQGVTCIRFKGRNVKVKTPVCKVLKKLRNPQKDEEKPTKLPARVLLELQPKNNAAWAEVQSVAHNPRLRIMVPLQKDMGRLLSFLSEKWTPHRIRLLHSLKPADKGFFSQVKLHVAKETSVSITPYNKLQGRFVHANSKTPFTLQAVDETKQDNSPSKGSDPATIPGGGKVDKNPEASVGQDIDCLLHPALDGNIEPMEVDLLANHHPSEPIIPDPGGLPPSMFGDSNHSLGDLLSNMGGGHLNQGSDALSFSSLSLTFSESHTSALSLAPPSADILSQAVSMTIDGSTERRTVTGDAPDLSQDSSDNKEISDGNMKVEGKKEEKRDVPKDVLLREGLTTSTASGMTVTDIYLMMGRPEALKFEYEFLQKECPVPELPSDQMMKKLVHLAKTSLTEVEKPKKEFVSVGVVTSPVRMNTPPSKSQHGGSSRSPSTTGRSPRGSGGRGGGRSSGSRASQSKAAESERQGAPGEERSEEARETGSGSGGGDGKEESATFAVPKSVAPIAARRSQEPSHAQAGQQMLQQLEQMKRPQANFLLPRMKKRQRGVKPIVVQRTILPRPLPQDGHQGDRMVSMAIINSSQANMGMGHFMPVKVSMSSLGNMATSRTGPRLIKPNTDGPTMSTCTTAGIAQTNTLPSSPQGVTRPAVRRITPVNVTDSPLSSGNIVHESALPSLSPAASPLMASSPTPESQVNHISTSQLAGSPSPSVSSPPHPLGSSTPAHGTPHSISSDPSIVILDQGCATPARNVSEIDMSILDGGLQTPARPISVDMSLLNTPDVGHATPARPVGMDESILNTPDHGLQTPSRPDSHHVDLSILNTPVITLKDSVSVPGVDDSLLGNSVLEQTLTSVQSSSMLDRTHTPVQSSSMLDQTLTPIQSSSMLDRTLTSEQSSSAVDSSVITAAASVISESPSSSSANQSALHISTPDISALLDISLPASENGDGLSSISLDSTTFKTFGRNISSTSPNSTTTEQQTSSTLSRDIGNISPTSSPFKSNSLGPEAHWYNGESLDISMSSLLGHLESPEKKDKSHQMSSSVVPMTTPLSVPTALLSEASRDSIITHDVDTTFHVMLNESSVDYVAKFADLAAHISATPDTPNKNNIIAKTLEADSATVNPPQPNLSSSETPSTVDK